MFAHSKALLAYTRRDMPLTGLIAPSIATAALLTLTLLYLGRPRRFYFVRHGQTVLNAQHVRQGPEGELSLSGRAQADRVGQALAPHQVSCILTSDYPRALETATIMNTHLKVSIIPSALFAERRNPSVIIGKHRDLPEVKQIVDQIENAYHDDNFRYSDEENFVDLKVRAHKALALLAHQGEDRTAIVTHHVFLKMLLAYMLHNERLHAGDFVKLSFFNFSDNATISVAEYRPLRRFSPSRGWSVLAYNEQPEALAI